MLQALRIGFIGMVLLGFVSSANAAPILTFNFLGSGQTFAPTDQVLIQGQITNIGTDPLVDGVGLGNITVPTKIFNQYIENFPPGLAPAPPGLTNLNPGESTTWTIAEYVPFPITGALGDPVELGQYILPVENVFTQFLTFVPEFSFIPSDTSNAADFVWTVTADGGGGPGNAPVPEPSTMLLLGSGIAGLAVWRQRKRKTQ